MAPAQRGLTASVVIKKICNNKKLIGVLMHVAVHFVKVSFQISMIGTYRYVLSTYSGGVVYVFYFLISIPKPQNMLLCAAGKLI